MGLFRDKHQYRVLTHDDGSSEGLADEEQASRVSTKWTSRWICMIIALVALLLCSLFAWLAFYSFPRGTKYQPGPLRFTREGTLQIAVFADLHFGESKWLLTKPMLMKLTF